MIFGHGQRDHDLRFFSPSPAFFAVSRSAEIGVIKLHYTLQNIPLLACFHGFSESEEHEPCGLVGDAELSHQIYCGHSALFGHEQICGDYPQAKLDVRPVHERAGGRRDLFSAALAAVKSSRLYLSEPRIPAMRADKALSKS